MNDKSGQPDRSRQPVTIALLVVLLGTCLNLLIWTGDRGRKSHVEGDLADEFVRVGGDMGFVRWSGESQLDEVDPNTLFAVVNGKIVGRFEFDSTSYQNLVSADINDNAQRSWIHADHLKRAYSVDRYPVGDTHTSTPPEMTYSDTDGDGLLDRKTVWQETGSFTAVSTILCDIVNSNGV
ncbi:MAG TPA: hypothetical protein PKN33_10200 [Phycisphaerae bacterium]|nr:hypothetical protein [Phycisphaerae bacterium]